MKFFHRIWRRLRFRCPDCGGETLDYWYFRMRWWEFSHWQDGCPECGWRQKNKRWAGLSRIPR